MPILSSSALIPFNTTAGIQNNGVHCNILVHMYFAHICAPHYPPTSPLPTFCLHVVSILPIITFMVPLDFFPYTDLLIHSYLPFSFSSSSFYWCSHFPPFNSSLNFSSSLEGTMSPTLLRMYSSTNSWCLVCESKSLQTNTVKYFFGER